MRQLPPSEMAQTRKAYLRMQIVMERRFKDQGCDDWIKEAIVGLFVIAGVLLIVGVTAFILK